MNRYLEKIARSEVKEHQSRVIDKLENNSVVAAHSMGSGKTLTALLAAEKAQKKYPNEHVTAIVPASLVSNMKDQAVQHGVDLDMDRFEVTTYDKASNDVNRLRQKNHSLIIVDEAHKLRNKDTKRSSEIEKVLKSSRKSLLLSGTPSYNKPEDIAVLVNKAAGTKVLPDNSRDFEDRFIGRRKVEPGFFAKHVLGVEPGEVTYLKNQGELREALNKYIDAYDAQEHNAGDFPTAHHRVVKVNMSPEQKRMYKFLEDDMPAPIKWKIRLGLPLSKKESSNLNAFSTGVRQVSNSTKPYSQNPDREPLSPKQLKMADSIEEKMLSDKNYRGISYSNYIESGLKPLSEELHRRGISHAIYDGSLSQREKDSVVDKYNKGEIKQLLISSSGAEGLNTKGTKLVQVMEPHFNKSKIDQVVARAVRYKSHEHLPEEERHVDVEHYHSIMEPGIIDKVIGQKTKTIDEYLHEASETKDKLRSDIMALTKQAQIQSDLLLRADSDPDIAGYVYPDQDRYRVPITSEEGNIVGFMTPRQEKGKWRTGAIYVDPEHRNKGYASKAITDFFADKAGMAYIDDGNEASKQAFRKAGFELNTSGPTARGLTLWTKQASERMNRYLEKIAEASDYAVPAAVGAGLGAGAGHLANKGLIHAKGGDFNKELHRFADIDKKHSDVMGEYFRRNRMSPEAEKNLLDRMDALATKRDASREALKTLNETAEHLRLNHNKYLKAAAAAGGLAGLGIAMNKSASDEYSIALPTIYGAAGAGIGARAVSNHLMNKINPLQQEHDAIKIWREHDLHYALSEADRVGAHVAPAYEELGRLREAGAGQSTLDAQRAKADRLYDLHKEKLKQVNYQVQRNAAGLSKMDELAGRIAKYTKIKNPAMIGAGLLAGGIGVGVGRLQGKSIDAEIANAYQ